MQSEDKSCGKAQYISLSSLEHGIEVKVLVFNYDGVWLVLVPKLNLKKIEVPKNIEVVSYNATAPEIEKMCAKTARDKRQICWGGEINITSQQ